MNKDKELEKFLKSHEAIMNSEEMKDVTAQLTDVVENRKAEDKKFEETITRVQKKIDSVRARKAKKREPLLGH